MLTEDRFNIILNLLEKKQSVTVLELTELLKTSESTIRRDLTELNKQGLLTKVHGGATSITIQYNTKDAVVSLRQDLNLEEKKRIAAYAASLIVPNDFIFLDAGTTTECLINYIQERNVVFVTNAIEHGRMLVQRGFKVYIIGGELKFATEAIVGSEAVDSLQKYNFTKGFFGTNGVSLKLGLTTPDMNEALVKKAAMKKCRISYILCDNSKFSQIAPVTFGTFAGAHIITTSLEDTTYKECKNVVEVDNL